MNIDLKRDTKTQAVARICVYIYIYIYVYICIYICTVVSQIVETSFYEVVGLGHFLGGVSSWNWASLSFVNFWYWRWKPAQLSRWRISMIFNKNCLNFRQYCVDTVSDSWQTGLNFENPFQKLYQKLTWIVTVPSFSMRTLIISWVPLIVFALGIPCLKSWFVMLKYPTFSVVLPFFENFDRKWSLYRRGCDYHHSSVLEFLEQQVWDQDSNIVFEDTAQAQLQKLVQWRVVATTAPVQRPFGCQSFQNRGVPR